MVGRDRRYRRALWFPCDVVSLVSLVHIGAAASTHSFGDTTEELRNYGDTSSVRGNLPHIQELG